MTQRAWVFILLGRQQGLDIVMLAVPDPDRSNQPRPWLPALVRGDQLYLFDTSLGLPIPGPGGKGVATLAQAAEDESILNGLDLDESHHYPIKAAEGTIRKLHAQSVGENSVQSRSVMTVASIPSASTSFVIVSRLGTRALPPRRPNDA